MFSREQAIRGTNSAVPDLTAVLTFLLSSFIQKNKMDAGLLCLWDDRICDAELLACHSIPMAPFEGGKHGVFVEFVKECLQRYPAPHIHNISDSEVWKTISSFVDTAEWQHRVLFLPAVGRDLEFILLCFAKRSTDFQLTEATKSSTAAIVDIIAFLLSAESSERTLRVMERYVKEIGHDIASSVQAIIAKLRNVSRGLIEGPAALLKVQEAEREIMAAYRVADTLGMTVDPDYNIGNGVEFDASDTTQEVIALCRSEAEERHIELRTELPDTPAMVWGDAKAIQSALIQLLMNAIKYARGSTYVTLRVQNLRDSVEYSVTDLGKPLDEDEKAHMWEFGFRGRRALEMHVNGSGIGLYTVKKVAEAHGGSVRSSTGRDLDELVTFAFKIPKRDFLDKRMLL